MTQETNQTPDDPKPTGDPAGTPEWMTGLSDDDRAHISKNGYGAESPEQLIQHLLVSDRAAMSKLGRPQDELIVKPNGEYAENRDGYLDAMRALGAPDEASGYGEAPTFDGLTFKPEAWSKLTESFAANGVPGFLVAPVLESVAEIVKAEGADGDTRTPAQKMEAGYDAMVGEVGKAKADQMIGQTQTLLKAKGDAGFAEFLEETGYGNDPRFLKFMAKISADYDESGMIGDERGDGGGAATMSKAQAQEELRKLENDPQAGMDLTDKRRPGHNAAVAKRVELSKIAYS